jgi:hypothetical protein
MRSIHRGGKQRTPSHRQLSNRMDCQGIPPTGMLKRGAYGVKYILLPPQVHGGGTPMSSQTWYVSGIWILRVMANFVKFMILEFVIENWAYILHVTVTFLARVSCRFTRLPGTIQLLRYYLRKFTSLHGFHVKCRSGIRSISRFFSAHSPRLSAPRFKL